MLCRSRFRHLGCNLKSEIGSQVVEFGLVILPYLALVFLIIDVAWVCFAKASLEYAVMSGVRAAVTSYVPSAEVGQDDYIKAVVQNNAMGFLAGQTGLDKITINYFSPANLSKSLTGAGSNTGGNVVEIAVTDVKVSAFGPIFRENLATLSLSAISSDVMESSPGGFAPAR